MEIMKERYIIKLMICESMAFVGGMFIVLMITVICRSVPQSLYTIQTVPRQVIIIKDGFM